jgi:hypothetical protein
MFPLPIISLGRKARLAARLPAYNGKQADIYATTVKKLNYSTVLKKLNYGGIIF